MHSISTICSPLSLTIYPSAQAMAPTNSCQEVHHTLGGSPFAHPIPSPPLRITRPLHRYSFRRVSFAHQRRFRSRQSPGSPLVVTSVSAVNGPPPPYTPTIDLHPSIIPPTGIPATSTTTADLHLSAPPQTQIPPHRMSATAIALIVVCTLVGLALCSVIGHFAYRKRLLLLRWPWRTRQEEESLGFVFVEYDDSTWGTPVKGAWREIPTFEAGSQEREGGEAHARIPSPLAPKVEAHPVPSTPQPDPSAPPENTCIRIMNGIVTTPLLKQVVRPSLVPSAKSVIGNTLGLALGDKLELSMLTSSELAAVLALHAGAESLDVLARPGLREQWPPDASEAEETEASIADSLSSGLVACMSSSTEESSGSEDDYELHRVETRSMDFKRGIIVSLGAITDTDGEGDEKPLPRVVISGSSSEVFLVALEPYFGDERRDDRPRRLSSTTCNPSLIT
ncbi:hypothetical protein BJY52DRAFT_926825 [Lactarius psammicola]|nr:hypothetical protein BJY52DRAFT_926825 [Lactarius psammicola]